MTTNDHTDDLTEPGPTHRVDTVVIGGGQAGLNTSRALQMADVDHVVLERGRIGESWSGQRWDSFRLNTPTWASGLLGFEVDDGDPDGFMTAGRLCEHMRAFVGHFGLPVREHTTVHEVHRRDGGFEVRTSAGTWTANNLVVCSGSQNVPRTPALADRISGVTQLHAAEYRNPDQLPSGGVLIVGGAQTGAQLAEELAAAGRDTYLCTSKVGSVPRRYRGRDIAAWMDEIGIVRTPVTALDDPAAKYQTQPLMTGVDGGHSISIDSLAASGVTVLGRLTGADGTRLSIGDDLAVNAATGRAALAQVCSNIDAYVERAGVDAPPAEDDPATDPFADLGSMAAIRELDLADRGIATVVWATGFTGDFSYLRFDVEYDDHGVPVQTDGASSIAGLYFCGFPWLRIQSSGLIYGSGADAKVVADHIRTADSVRPFPAGANA